MDNNEKSENKGKVKKDELQDLSVLKVGKYARHRSVFFKTLLAPSSAKLDQPWRK